jgi:hypothetical protein
MLATTCEKFRTVTKNDPAMLILGELSDIFGDAQRGVWLEIRLRLRVISKLFSRHFLDRTQAFFEISRRATTKGVSTEEVFSNQFFADLVARPHRALMRY